MNIIFSINGGCGKCVAATAVCAAIKKQYPNSQLIVLSGYPEVFINNPDVDMSLAFGSSPYFYQHYIQDKEVKLMFHDPYVDTGFVEQETHLIKIWCDMYNIPFDNEMPKVNLTKRELDFYQKGISSEKPILLLQTNGGGDSNIKYSWSRDLPQKTVIEIIDHFKDKYTICHIRREDQIAYKDTIPVTAPFRQLAALALKSSKRLLIDSVMQHMCAALNLPSVVCWICNTPKVFGYDLHTNVLSNPITVKPNFRDSFITKWNIGGMPIEFPYNDESEIFNTAKIIEALEAMEDSVVVSEL